eukprot:m.180811 g.180811  ORF g.180811 m.180811 type:complete len:146 (+) comp15503_c2_seq1:203-640(+)
MGVGVKLNVQTDDSSPLLHKPSELGKGGQASFWACVFNLANVVMGAGILAFPYAFKHAGYGLGAILATICAVVFWYTLGILSEASDEAWKLAKEGKAIVTEGSYQEITKAVLGPYSAMVRLGNSLLCLTKNVGNGLDSHYQPHAM